ncbi:DegQ family serine endoprotease [Leptothrix discophora]|uniref:Probable periplasmic serine endoprotease DegP-like n=1 Tax=Leptothrix discophora TaxID=89 RepID=A0ABT9G012_LEPDI|nr:DegQ family serine endoprotease [Leptothrix discophora]MDP4299818.1 DegQ family serine endoprotease [Leptothrix discophora]
MRLDPSRTLVRQPEQHVVVPPGVSPWRRRAAGLLAAFGTSLAALLAVGLTSSPAPAVAQASAAVRGLPDFADLVEQVGPAVVNIRTTAKAKAGRNSAEAGPDEEMQEFFRRFFGVPVPRQGPRQSPPGQQQEEEQQQTPRGVGSGFILSADGYIMTNAHVVDGADEVNVRLTDKREFKARIIGADKRTDVAVLKVEASGLPTVKLGDVGKLRVGEWVIAIGSPFDLDNTVTAGIVSAKARDTGDLVPFIQTDVAINPGNSGGPLINMRGEVVGVNSQIYSRSGGYMGISFAIPIDEARRVADQLREKGRVVRGRIGVQIGEVTKDVAESLGLGKAAGALVRSVESGSPADKAGLEAGDIVTRFDGKAVEKWNDLPRLVGNTNPGSKSSITVVRRGTPRELAIVVAEMEAEASAKPAADPSPAPKAAPKPASATLLGLTVSELTAEQRSELKIKGGVKVDAVDGAAARAGLREGDIILAVANNDIADLRQFESVAAKLDKSKPVNVLFRRGEWAQYVVIRPSK